MRMTIAQARTLLESHGFHLVLRPGIDHEADVYAQEMIDLSVPAEQRKTVIQVKREEVRLGTRDSLGGKRPEDICVDLVDNVEEILKGKKNEIR